MATEPQTAQDIRTNWLADGWIPLCLIEHSGGLTEHWVKKGLHRTLAWPGGPCPAKECTIGIWHKTEAATDLLKTLKETVEELAHCAVRKDYRAKLENIRNRAFATIAKATKQEG